MTVACQDADSDGDTSEDKIVVEHSGDSTRKVILTASEDFVSYCEVAFNEDHTKCLEPTAAVIVLPFGTYQSKLAVAFDRLFPDFAAAVASSKRKVDAAQGVLDGIQQKLNQVNDDIARRDGELAEPARQIRIKQSQVFQELAALRGRNTVVDSELVRVRGLLADPNLNATDRQVLTKKEATLVSEKATNDQKIAQDEARMDDFRDQLDRLLNNDPEMVMLIQRRAALTEQVKPASDVLTAANRELGTAAGARDEKLGAKLELITRPEFNVVDEGDTVSKLVFEPFRSQDAVFAKNESCSWKITRVNTPTHAALGSIDIAIAADTGAIFPRFGRLSPETNRSPWIQLEDGASERMSFESASFLTEAALDAPWPPLTSVTVPTGTVRCTATP